MMPGFDTILGDTLTNLLSSDFTDLKFANCIRFRLPILRLLCCLNTIDGIDNTFLINLFSEKLKILKM